MKQLLLITIGAVSGIDYTFITLADSPIIPIWITDIMKFIVFSSAFLFSILLLWLGWIVVREVVNLFGKKLLNKKHSSFEITATQKIKFWIAWQGPSILWCSVIFIPALPLPDGLRDFIVSETKHNPGILIAPAIIWSIVGLFYGFWKGHLKPG